MASRVGKYKLSKKESALSLEDGGTIAGALTVTGGNITFTGFSDQAGAATTSNKLFITGSSGITGSGTSYKVLCIG
jgi:hypothetical protein